MADSEDEKETPTEEEPSESGDGEPADAGGDAEEESDEPSNTGEKTDGSEDDGASESEAGDDSGADTSASETSDGPDDEMEYNPPTSESDSDEDEASVDASDTEDDEDEEKQGEVAADADEDGGDEREVASDADDDEEDQREAASEADEDGEGEQDVASDSDEQTEDEEPETEPTGRSDRALELGDALRERRPHAADEQIESILDGVDELEEDYEFDKLFSAAVLAIDAGIELHEVLESGGEYERREPGVAAFFDHPDDLLRAARITRESPYERFDAYSPFPIHGMDEAMGLERSWIPWVTFGAGLFGFLCAVAMEFGMMTFDWPMIIGGKPFAPWPAFVPIMFELTVLIGGVTTGIVMLRAAGCFEPADVIDPGLTDDRFALWISGEDPEYDQREVVEYVQKLEPVEVRTFSEET